MRAADLAHDIFAGLAAVAFAAGAPFGAEVLRYLCG